MKKALITGITGQDGSYLAAFLLQQGYIVHGIRRRSSLLNTQRIDHLFFDPQYEGRFFLHYGDMTDGPNLIHLIQKIEPDEVYNLAAQSHVQVSFETPQYTTTSDATGVMLLLEAIRMSGFQERTKFYQASTSEMFGKVQEMPQRETTPFYPRSPYGVAKLYGYWITVNYREAYNMFAVNGILFNHESPWRGENFVTRKITIAVAQIAHGKIASFSLGNLNAMRDWGHTRDFVRGMWLIMQNQVPEDFVLATGQTTSVRDFVRMAFAEIGVHIEFEGEGLHEVARVVASNHPQFKVPIGQVVVTIDPKYFRPAEVEILVGDAAKARQKLGWEPHITLPELVHEMVEADLKRFAY